MVETVELWLKTIQIGYPTFKAHSRITCGILQLKIAPGIAR